MQKHRNTFTTSLSLDWAIAETMERERKKILIMRREMPRAEYVAQALLEKWRRDGVKVARDKE